MFVDCTHPNIQRYIFCANRFVWRIDTNKMSESSSGQGLLKLINEYLSFYELPTPARSDVERVNKKLSANESAVKRNIVSIERRAKMRSDMVRGVTHQKQCCIRDLIDQYCANESCDPARASSVTYRSQIPLVDHKFYSSSIVTVLVIDSTTIVTTC